MAKSLQDYKKAIEASLEDISKLTFNAELLGVQEARVQLEQRTFALGGQGVKDSSGNSLSKYSAAYARRRERSGLQTTNKDLIFTGEFSRNVTVGTSNGKPAYGFVTAQAAKIAEGQEKREGVEIFTLNQSEIDNVRETVKESLMAAIREMVKKWGE